MTVIHIRGVPGHVYRRLVEQAEREHRSLAQQTLAVLSHGLEVGREAKARRKKVLEAIAGMESFANEEAVRPRTLDPRGS